MKPYIFIYSNLSTSKLYSINLNCLRIDNKFCYEFIDSNIVNLQDYLLKNKQITSKDNSNGVIAFTNIKAQSNLYRLLKNDFTLLRFFNTKDFNLEDGLFAVRDLIIGDDLKFSSAFYKKKIIDNFDRLDEGLNDITRGDNCILLSLVYLIAAINKPSSLPAIPSMSFYANF